MEGDTLLASRTLTLPLAHESPQAERIGDCDLGAALVPCFCFLLYHRHRWAVAFEMYDVDGLARVTREEALFVLR